MTIIKDKWHIVNLVVLSLILQPVRAQNWEPVQGRIMSSWAEDLQPDNTWQEYPRPQLVREDWKNLNGLWEYAIRSKNESQPDRFDGNILVPFCVESALSGVGRSVTPEDQLWYRKRFTIPKSWQSEAILLHFEAVDYHSTLWINGALVGSHSGGYDRFSFDITPFLKGSGKQEILLRVTDPTSSGSQPRGKQKLEPGGIFYTPVTGIWQTVWVEPVNVDVAIGELKIVPDIDAGEVTIMPITNRPLERQSLGWGKGYNELYQVRLIVRNGDEEVTSVIGNANAATRLPIPDPRLWSPHDPFLYDLEVRLLDHEGKELDRLSSYFGMRKISLIEQNGYQVLALNNERLFHYGLLDQGWWPDGLYTAPSDEALRYDIEMTRKMGFNMIRKHVKIEPDRWYHHCDKLGVLVWQDMPAAYAHGDVGDKYPDLENVHLWQGIGFTDADMVRRSSVEAQFEYELSRMVDIHYNAPSIVVWVPFNEGWGQYATNRIVNMIKAKDPTRLVNPTSGWSLRTSGDMYSIHSYQVDITVPPTSVDRASVLGEFGGIGYAIRDHVWDQDLENWGYQSYESDQEYLENYKKKFDQIVDMQKHNGLSAAVYTQTTDVESEVNGLMTYDRKVLKIPVDELLKIHSQLWTDQLYPPSGTIVPYHTDWTRNHYTERIDTFMRDPLSYGNVVFIGNSITEGWEKWDEELTISHVRNRGISGDVTDGVLQRINEIVYYQPKSIFVLIGVNDLFNLYYQKEMPSPEYAANNILKIAEILSGGTPDSKLFVQTLLPTDRSFINAHIDIVNEIIRANEENGHYQVIDLNALFSGDDGLLKEELTYDGTHLNQKGYEVWLEYITPYLRDSKE